MLAVTACRAGARVGLVSRDGTLARIMVVGKDNPQSTAGQALVSRIREGIIPATGIDAVVGGQGASDLDLTDKISERLPWVIGGVLMLSFLLLVVALRSIILPLKAIVMNLMSVAAAYGVVVALFQWGWGEDVLRFESEGFIQAFVPLFLFSVLFGLSMDYEVFLMTRMREEWDRTGSNELAVARGFGADRPHRDIGGVDHGGGVRRLHRKPITGLQGHGIRAGRGGADRCDRGTGGGGTGRDAVAGRPELVAAGVAGPAAAPPGIGAPTAQLRRMFVATPCPRAVAQRIGPPHC